MRIEEKKMLLAYLQSHDDGSETAEELIRMMQNSAGYADTDSHSVCAEDLSALDGCALGDTLREKLGKHPGEAYTPEDCQRIADAMTEFMADEFSETLASAIEYEL